MTYKAYDVAGTFTDTTNDQQYIYANGVNLTSSFSGADVFADRAATITATAAGVYVFVGTLGQGSITLNAGDDRVYAGAGSNLNVVANGTNDQIFGASTGSNAYFLQGTNDSFFGSAEASIVSVSGNSDKVNLTNSASSVTVNLAIALNAAIDGGGGTLKLNDYVGDNGMLTMDVGKNTVSNANGLTIANVGNLDYTIANPGSANRRTASTKFTLESGANTLDFSYSSGSNTVYNTGGSTTVSGGSGTDTVVGGTGLTKLMSEGGTDTLYGGSGTNILQPVGAAAGTNRFYGGSGTNNFFGVGGGGTANDYMYGASGTDYFQGGGGNNVLVEGTHSDEFHGTVGNDFIYGSSAASKVYGGANSDFVYTGASNQYFYSGTGKEYLYEEASTLTNGRLDVVDNFQTQSAGGNGTFIFEPTADANKTTFVASGTGTYIVNPAVNMASGTSDVFVPNVAPSIVKAQTYFNL